MKKNCLILILVSIATSKWGVGALPEIPADAEGAKVWKSRREISISELQTKPSAEAIAGLGEMLRQLKSLHYRECPERDEIVRMLQAQILAIPGHAKYYHDKIELLRSEVLETANLSDDQREELEANMGREIPHVTDYENYCSVKAFPTLANLPSPETVAVLGTYLNETTGRDGKTLLGESRSQGGGDDLTLRPCNAELAAFAIARLGIENPPYRNPTPDKLLMKIPDEWVDHWKDWWNEVKAGERTYRFIGSSIEYGPDGPATQEQLEKVAKNRKRAEEKRYARNATMGQSGSSTGGIISNAPLLASILAGLVVLASLIWYFRKAKTS